MPIIPYYEQVTGAGGQVTYTSPTNLPTPSEIRERWCFGLPLNKEDGGVMTDEDLLQFLMGAINQVERFLGIYLKPTVIVTNPEERGLEKGVDYEIAEAPYDYDARAYRQWGFLQLRERPVQQLNGFKMVLPNGMVIIDFMTKREWIKLYPENGQLHIVPYAGDPTIFALLGGSQAGFPFVTGQMNSHLPQMFYVDYVAGYGLHQIPEDIRNVVAKIASIDALGIAGDAVLAGVASLSTSIDGLSESFSTTASATSATYGAHIKQYQDEVDKFFSAKGAGARTSERGFTMTGL